MTDKEGCGVPGSHSPQNKIKACPPGWDNSSAAWGRGPNDLSRSCPALKIGCTLPSRRPSSPFPPKHLSDTGRHVKAPLRRNWESVVSAPAPGREHSEAVALLTPLPSHRPGSSTPGLRGWNAKAWLPSETLVWLLSLQAGAPACLQSPPGHSSQNSLS